MSCLQHVHLSCPGAIVCKCCATHQGFITCNMLCATWHSSAVKLDSVEITFILYLTGLQLRQLQFSVFCQAKNDILASIRTLWTILWNLVCCYLLCCVKAWCISNNIELHFRSQGFESTQTFVIVYYVREITSLSNLVVMGHLSTCSSCCCIYWFLESKHFPMYVKALMKKEVSEAVREDIHRADMM